MTLDTIDRALIARWQARRATLAPTNQVVHAEATTETVPATAVQAGTEGVSSPPRSAPESVPSTPVEQSLMERLLTEGQEQWECLADEVEVARREGHRVIAVIGGEPSEGRTMLVDCLAHTLRDRGRDVLVVTSTDDAPELHGGQGNDRRIVLVDAGVWFPPGPIRRQRLVQESVGCDAAILVRRANREPVAARATALAALGMTVLGEVVTFASFDGDT